MDTSQLLAQTNLLPLLDDFASSGCDEMVVALADPVQSRAAAADPTALSSLNAAIDIEVDGDLWVLRRKVPNRNRSFYIFVGVIVALIIMVLLVALFVAIAHLIVESYHREGGIKTAVFGGIVVGIVVLMLGAVAVGAVRKWRVQRDRHCKENYLRYPVITFVNENK